MPARGSLDVVDVVVEESPVRHRRPIVCLLALWLLILIVHRAEALDKMESLRSGCIFRAYQAADGWKISDKFSQ